MPEQTILACDEQGNFLEYIAKEEGHKGKGRRHLAVTVLLYNSKGQLLLQRRKHKIFDNLWDFTASTHLLHESSKDETFEEAARRALKEEWEIREVSEIREIGEFNYFAPYQTVQAVFCENQQAVFCENEHDVFLMGEYNGEIKMDPEVGYEYKWMDRSEFLEDIKKDPSKYTEWTKESVKLLEKINFFNTPYPHGRKVTG